MHYCKNLNLCWIFFSILFLGGCSVFQNDLAKRSHDKTLPNISYTRTISDVSSIGIEWKLPKNLSNVEGYAIMQQDSKHNNKTLAIIKNPYATHYFISGLLPQTHYSFSLVVLGKNNKIAQQGKIIEAKTSFIDPIENIFASKNLPKEIKIFWSPHSNPSIKRYIVQRKNDKGEFLNIGVVPHRLFVEFFDTNLDDGKSYTYRILSENFEGIGSLPSQIVEGSTRNKPLALPYIHASNHLARSILLTWNIPKNTPFPLGSFKIYAADSKDGKFKLIGQSKKASFKENNLKDNQIRFYKVVPVDLDGVEGDLNIPSIKGITLPPLPIPNITSAVIKNHQAVIQWNLEDPQQRVKSFQVCRTQKGDAKTKLCFENIEKNHFVDKELQPKISYHYEVFSVDANKVLSQPSTLIKLGL